MYTVCSLYSAKIQIILEIVFTNFPYRIYKMPSNNYFVQVNKHGKCKILPALSFPILELFSDALFFWYTSLVLILIWPYSLFTSASAAYNWSALIRAVLKLTSSKSVPDARKFHAVFSDDICHINSNQSNRAN